MIFQEIKDMLISRQFAKIDDKKLDELMRGLGLVIVAKHQNGEEFPDEYFELRDWIYERVSKNLKLRNTGYINEHFCIGVIWGMIRMCDDSFSIKEWDKYME